MCQNCDRICEWNTRVPVEDDSDGYKTIGNRFCHALECIEEDARGQGLPVGAIMQQHGMPTAVEMRAAPQPAQASL
jgi:hypothetical protein